MKSNSQNSPLDKEHSKDRHFQAQMKRVFTAFYSHPKTMLMVSIETGIYRANICRYVAKWEKQSRIRVIKKGLCPITRHRAGFYTTNPELFPPIVDLFNSIVL